MLDLKTPTNVTGAMINQLLEQVTTSVQDWQRGLVGQPKWPASRNARVPVRIFGIALRTDTVTLVPGWENEVDQSVVNVKNVHTHGDVVPNCNTGND